MNKIMLGLSTSSPFGTNGTSYGVSGYGRVPLFCAIGPAYPVIVA